MLDASHDLVGGLPTAHGVPLKNLPKVSVTDVKSDAFSLNPVRLSLLADGRIEDCHTAATRVVEILRIVFRLSAVQGIYLTEALRDYLTRCNGAGSLPGFLAFARTSLRKEEQKRIELAIARLENFVHSVNCSADCFDWQLETPGVTVIDFSRVPSETEQALLVELALADIWAQRLQKQDANIPTVIVLDEAQKFTFKANSYTVKLLREGRKYQMSGFFASQWISDKEALAALEQAALRAYFRPEPSNAPALAKRLAAGDKELTSIYERHLSRLKRGQFLYHDQNGRPIIANVAARD